MEKGGKNENVLDYIDEKRNPSPSEISSFFHGTYFVLFFLLAVDLTGSDLFHWCTARNA
jgi:hypothetical protein